MAKIFFFLSDKIFIVKKIYRIRENMQFWPPKDFKAIYYDAIFPGRKAFFNLSGKNCGIFSISV